MTSNTSSQQEDRNGPDTDSRLNGWLRFSLLAASSLTVMAGATMSPSLPAMKKHFLDVPDVAFWVKLLLTLPALFIALSAPLAGWVADRFGRKRLLVLCTILYGISGTAGFFLDSLVSILVSRAVLGISVAGVITSATALISDYFHGPERARFMGYQAAFMGLGGVVFLLAGGALSEWSWRGPFLVYSFAFFLAPIAALAVFEPERKHGYESAFPGDPEAAALLYQVGRYAQNRGNSYVSATLFYDLLDRYPESDLADDTFILLARHYYLPGPDRNPDRPSPSWGRPGRRWRSRMPASCRRSSRTRCHRQSRSRAPWR